MRCGCRGHRNRELRRRRQRSLSTKTLDLVATCARGTLSAEDSLPHCDVVTCVLHGCAPYVVAHIEGFNAMCNVLPLKISHYATMHYQKNGFWRAKAR